ncbi:MAG: phosphoribosylglycinamide formyltransferase [Clostridiales bacterium]|jgi:phosphoribosylglycinamide formyltransferase-1|nr:phosphoribosylglycinamide formyltransferase [Clostridiales bacterium]
MKKNIAVFASGGGSDFQSVIDAVKSGYIDAEIKLLISGKDDAYAVERAKNNGIPYFIFKKSDYGGDSESMFSDIGGLLDERGIDLVVLAGYLSILAPGFVKKYYGKIINIHPSLIPKHCGMGYYGIKVHESVIASGDKTSGATVHFVDEGADTGDIILQREVEVKDGDIPETLQRRVLEAEHKILPEAVKAVLEGKCVIGKKTV